MTTNTTRLGSGDEPVSTRRPAALLLVVAAADALVLVVVLALPPELALVVLAPTRAVRDGSDVKAPATPVAFVHVDEGVPVPSTKLTAAHCFPTENYVSDHPPPAANALPLSGTWHSAGRSGPRRSSGFRGCLPGRGCHLVRRPQRR